MLPWTDFLVMFVQRHTEHVAAQFFNLVLFPLYTLIRVMWDTLLATFQQFSIFSLYTFKIIALYQISYFYFNWICWKITFEDHIIYQFSNLEYFSSLYIFSYFLFYLKGGSLFRLLSKLNVLPSGIIGCILPM